MTTFSTTAKHALRWLTGANVGSDIDAGFQALAQDLDAIIAIADKGVLASRPTSTGGSPGKSGRFYYATDTAQLFFDYGTGWALIAEIATWTTATLLNSWGTGAAAYYEPGYLRQDGIVRLRGIATRGVGSALGIFSLPAGYRPSKEQLYSVAAGTGGTSAVVSVDINGTVQPASSQTTVWLDGISFRAEQ